MVFNGEPSRAEFGCARHCCPAEDAAYVRAPHARLPAELLNRFPHKSPQHFADRTALLALPYDARWNDPYWSR
ncbi:hypothetical protein ACFV19_18490 [Streptomyces griseoluteus]|uniref:hypothetical protein n=1 Tax=Streptomyces griseoluteus TaxID=29306 RepID=UPI00367A6155